MRFCCRRPACVCLLLVTSAVSLAVLYDAITKAAEAKISTKPSVLKQGQKNSTFRLSNLRSKPFKLSAEQLERQRILHNACKSSNQLVPPYKGRKQKPEKPFSHTIVFPRQKLLVCPVPKAGSTLWRDILTKFYGGSRFEKTITPVPETLATYKSAIFVRHPFSRLFSCYNDKVVSLTASYTKGIGDGISSLVRKFDRANYSPCYDDITFEEFVQLVLLDMRRDYNHSNVHWRSMAAICKPCSQRYDIIGKLETADVDVTAIEKLMDFHSTKFSVNRTKMQEQLLEEKCGMMSIVHLTPFRYERDSPCHAKDVLLKAKLRALSNRGYTQEVGFMYETFYNVSTRDWKHLCIKLVKETEEDEGAKGKVTRSAAQAIREAYKGLREDTMDMLIKMYQVDFSLFNYDPYKIV